MTKKTIGIEVEARYFLYPDQLKKKDTPIHYIWMVAHGYGQLAEFFIRHFRVLPAHHAVIAPEGLHRFYLQNNSGRVGASWMTKLERETDIRQYVHLFDEILQKEMNRLSDGQNKAKIIALGFSQGAATISRWLCNAHFDIDVLVLWAGAWPEDLDIQYNKNKLSKIDIIIVIGEHDEYLGENGISKYISVFDDNEIGYTLITFDGKHQMHRESILKVASLLPAP